MSNKLIYYGFNITSHQCLFSADGPTAYQEDVVVLSDTAEYQPGDIKLGCDDIGNFFIIQIEKAPVDLAAIANAKKEQVLLDASNRLAILCTVNKTRNDPAVAAKIAAWESYIAEVYFIDVSNTSVVWPPMPELI